MAVIGENLVDQFTDEAGVITRVPGGGPFTVARTIARLGQRSVLFSGISTDEFGAEFKRLLGDDGVALATPEAVDLPTPFAYVQTHRDGPTYSFDLDDTAAFHLERQTALKTFHEFGHDVAALYVGTLGVFIEPMASVGEAMVGAAPPTTMVILDPNCRPSSVADRSDYRERLRRLLTRCDVVKVSVEDLGFLAGEATGQEVIAEFFNLGVRWVIISGGPSAVEVVGPDENFLVSVPMVDVVDPVGAGDALVGGFIAWWVGHGLYRTDLADADLVLRAVAAAVAVASLTCTRRGAEPPRIEELTQIDGWNVA